MPSGFGKFITLYSIDVRLKDGTKRNLRINSQYIKENNDYSFDLKDPKFIEGIWDELNQSITNI